jgi:hypothetical protein
MQVGPWTVGETLGRGGMGIVLSAEHSVLGTPAAVKLMVGSSSPRARALFEGEARALAAVDHPNVVRAFDYGRLQEELGGIANRGSPYLVMERCDGGSAAKNPPEDTATLHSMVRAMLAALARIHGAGMVHRDVKPHNILRADPDRRTAWKLTDFGVAWTGSSGTEVVGSRVYMAPEQMAGDLSALGPWTDLYGLGRSVLRLLTGNAVTDLGDLADRELARWLERLVAPDPRVRFRRAADAARALSAPLDAPVKQGPALDEASTFVFDAPLADAVQGLDVEVPRFVRKVSVSRPPPTEPALVDPRCAGLPLFAFRPFPALADGAANALWRHLEEVAEQGTSRVVHVVGPQGVGRRLILQLFVQEAHATGVAHVLLGPPERAVPAYFHTRGMDGERIVRRLQQEVPAGLLAPLAEVISPGSSSVCAAPVTLSGRAEARAVVQAWVASLDRCVVWLVEESDAAEVPACPSTLVLVRASGAGANNVHLAPRGSGDLGRALVYHAGLAPADAHRIALKSGGLPAVAAAIVNDLAGREALVSGQAGHTIAPGVTLDLPMDHRARWSGRLAAVTRSRDRGLLAVAAHLDPVNSADLVSAALQAGLGSPDDLAERLLRAGLATPTQPGWRFADPAIREAAFDEDPRWARAAVAWVSDPERRVRLLARLGRQEKALEGIEHLVRTKHRTGDPGTIALLELYERLLPDADPRRAFGLLRLAAVRRQQGRFEEASELGGRVLNGQGFRDSERKTGWTR